LRMMVLALFLETQFFSCIKEIIKYNVLQYVKPGNIYFSRAKQRIDINPQVLQNAALDFKLADGLLSSAKLADTEFLNTFLQLILTNQEMNQRFDVPQLVGYLASLRNVPDIAAFARQPEGQPRQPAQTAEGQVVQQQVGATPAPPPQEIQ
jgi:hypothetical protein